MLTHPSIPSRLSEEMLQIPNIERELTATKVPRFQRADSSAPAYKGMIILIFSVTELRYSKPMIDHVLHQIFWSKFNIRVRVTWPSR